MSTSGILVSVAIAIATLLLVRGWWTHRYQSNDIQRWIDEQLTVANFRFAGHLGPSERLRLRAIENRRVKNAFDIDNSLTTSKSSVHKAFLRTAAEAINKQDRSWTELYGHAGSFLRAEIQNALSQGHRTLPLAECARCMVLAVILFDNFGIDPAATPRAALATITQEINRQWQRSKCEPDVNPSELLNSAVASLNLQSPGSGPKPISPAAILSLIMPQYETLWRVVMLAFVTAYHHQPAASPDVVQRTADVPSCLGDAAKEGEALKLGKVRTYLPSCPSHVYRSYPN